MSILVIVVDKDEAMHGQIVLDGMKEFGSLREKAGKTAGCDDFHGSVTLAPHFAHDAFHQPDIAPIHAGLHAGHRIRPDGFGGFRDVNMG